MKKAFTLIELLVTVAIIAVIGAGVAMTFGSDLVEDAKQQVTIHEMGQIRDAFQRFWADNSSQMLGGMTLADSDTRLPHDFDFSAADEETYSSAKPAESQRLYGAMQFLERYGLWPLVRKSIHRRNGGGRIQIFDSQLESRRYEFLPPSPVTGEGWRGSYINSAAVRECVAHDGIVEAVVPDGSGFRGAASRSSISDSEARFPQPATKYDDGANGGIYRVVYYEHCENEREGMPIYRRLLLMAATDPSRYDTWEELRVFAGNRRYAPADGKPLDMQTGGVQTYDEENGVFFMELLNFDTVYR